MRFVRKNSNYPIHFHLMRSVFDINLYIHLEIINIYIFFVFFYFFKQILIITIYDKINNNNISFKIKNICYK